jgi:hypothetical protein
LGDYLLKVRDKLEEGVKGTEILFEDENDVCIFFLFWRYRPNLGLGLPP